MADWFRSPDWSDDAQRDFESRLLRSRLGSRPQYLRIKALAIEAAGQSESATALRQRIVADFADTWPEVAFAHERLGDSHRTAGDLAGADAECRLALKVSPSLSGTTGEVHIKLGEVLLESGTGTIAEIEELLAAAKSHAKLNSTVFRFNVLVARLASATGDIERRRRAARAALDLVDADPQFSRHPTVGLVQAAPALLQELTTMASA